MRFKEFLVEREIKQFDDVVEKVRKNCQPFLKASHGKLVFRGMAPYSIRDSRMVELPDDIGRYSPHPSDRKPLNSGAHPYFNFMFNAGCEGAFGVEDIRKSTIFATSNVDLAGIFGNIYVFYPVGEFKFLHSRTIKDSYESAATYRESIAEALPDYNLKSGDIRAGFGKLDSMMGPHEWWEGSTSRHGESVQESTARCFGIQDEEADQFYEDLKFATRATFRYFYKDDQDLAEAIKNPNEILFYETHGYYTIPLRMFSMEMERRGIEHERDIGDGRITKFARDFMMGKIK